MPRLRSRFVCASCGFATARPLELVGVRDLATALQVLLGPDR